VGLPFKEVNNVLSFINSSDGEILAPLGIPLLTPSIPMSEYYNGISPLQFE
jgi:hypothetical protein